MLEIVSKFSHNSTLADSEPKWGSLDKTKLPRSAHADTGDPGKKGTWKYPHHWISSGGEVNDAGVYTTGTMYLHKGGLIAAWAAAQGARSGQQAPQKVKSHLNSHRKALGLEKFVFIDAKAQADEYQVVYGEVYAPNRIDTDYEAMTAEEVQKAAWDFLASGKVNNIDIQHDLIQSGCQVVESFVARSGDPDFTEGAWVLGVKCPDEVWKKVKDGDLNGFSFYGSTQKHPARVLIEVAKQITGVTEESTVDIIPAHSHAFIVNLSNKGEIVSGKTDAVMEHTHTIKHGTATELSLDHSHRIFLE